MKFIVAWIVICLLSFSAMAQTKWAMVVGIGNYPLESGWSKIHGDDDVDLVLAMLNKQGFTKAHYSVLRNSEATKRNIRLGIDNLIAKLSLGDDVYIHFSTHGQQVIDISGDESDNKDEAIIPYDAYRYFDENKYRGENHILDDEINVWLKNIRAKIGSDGCLMVVLDACHSGDGTRSEDNDDVFVRGAAECFNPNVNVGSGKYYVKESVDWIAISACKTYQSNYEYKVGDRYYGRLTYALSQVYKSGIRADELFGKLRCEYELMPLYRDCIQTLYIDCPDSMKEKILFNNDR